MTVGNAIQALRAGWILRNPSTWKNRTVAINALVALFGVALAITKELGYELILSDDIVSAAALVVWGVFNAWSTAATTDKIGLLPKSRDTGVDGPPDSSGGPV